MSAARLPTIPVAASSVARKPTAIIIIDDESDDGASNNCARKPCANSGAARSGSLHEPFKKETPFHDILQSLVGYNSDDDRKMAAVPSRQMPANRSCNESLSATGKPSKRRKLVDTSQPEQRTCLYCGASRQELEGDMATPCPDCHTPTGINEMIAKPLVEEQSIVHMLTRENQEMVEHEGMLQTSEGRAILFAKEILKIDPLAPSARSQGEDLLAPSIVCMPVGEDDMVFLAIRLFKLQQEFLRAGKSTHVRLAYHYTSSVNVNSIRENGLMSMEEQKRNPDKTDRRGPTHGAVFGDGVYCACNPFAFRRYGDCGLLVAILMGEVSPRMASRLRADMTKLTTDTVLGNKRTHAYDQTESSTVVTSEDKLLFEDEIVLKKSDQVLPLLRYDASDIVDDPDAIWSFQEQCQQVVDKFFNRGISTKIHRYGTNEPAPFARSRLQRQKVPIFAARSGVAAGGTAATLQTNSKAVPPAYKPSPTANVGAFSPSALAPRNPTISSVSQSGNANLTIQLLEKRLFEGMKKLADIPSQRHRALQMLKQQSLRLQQQLSTSALGIQLGQKHVQSLEQELKNLEKTMAFAGGAGLLTSALGSMTTTQGVQGSQVQLLPATVTATTGKPGATPSQLFPTPTIAGKTASGALPSRHLKNAPATLTPLTYIAPTSMAKVVPFATNSQPSVSLVAPIRKVATSPASGKGQVGAQQTTTTGSANLASRLPLPLPTVPTAPSHPPLAAAGNTWMPAPIGSPQPPTALAQLNPAAIACNASPSTGGVNAPPTNFAAKPAATAPTTACTPTTVAQPPQNNPTPSTPVVLEYVSPEKMAPNNVMEFCHRMRTAKTSQECPICLETLICSKMGRALILKACGHHFHSKCIEACMQRDLKCPVCRKPVTEPQGRCPSGSMTITGCPHKSCQGHGRCGTIEIRYLMGGGIQKAYHTNPGRAFGSTSRTAYIPDNEDGRKLLKRLKYAWLRGLTFDVGTSLTTGRSNSIVWASIHHKTSMYGGAHGFPDRGYFFNCNEELDALNVPKADQL